MAPSDPETWIRDLLAHREKLRDAATKGKITGDTELVALAKINKNNAKGRLVWNLSNIAEPAEPCTLILDEGIVFPPTPDSGDYQISVTFRELVRKTMTSVQALTDIFAVDGSCRSPRMQLELDVKYFTRSQPQIGA